MRRRNDPVMKSVESVLAREETLWWERFVKEVCLRFEQGVKEWGNYGWGEWYVNKGRCGRSRKRQVSDTETGMRLTERRRELIPETRLRPGQTSYSPFARRGQNTILARPVRTGRDLKTFAGFKGPSVRSSTAQSTGGGRLAATPRTDCHWTVSMASEHCRQAAAAAAAAADKNGSKCDAVDTWDRLMIESRWHSHMAFICNCFCNWRAAMMTRLRLPIIIIIIIIIIIFVVTGIFSVAGKLYLFYETPSKTILNLLRWRF